MNELEKQWAIIDRNLRWVSYGLTFAACNVVCVIVARLGKALGFWPAELWVRLLLLMPIYVLGVCIYIFVKRRFKEA